METNSNSVDEDKGSPVKQEETSLTDRASSPRPAPEHGFRLCMAPHRDGKFAAPHCQCGESHESHGFTFPELIYTVGGDQGSFFLKPGTFAKCEYIRADLVIAFKHVPERDSDTEKVG